MRVCDHRKQLLKSLHYLLRRHTMVKHTMIKWDIQRHNVVLISFDHGVFTNMEISMINLPGAIFFCFTNPGLWFSHTVFRKIWKTLGSQIRFSRSRPRLRNNVYNVGLLSITCNIVTNTVTNTMRLKFDKSISK